MGASWLLNLPLVKFRLTSARTFAAYLDFDALLNHLLNVNLAMDGCDVSRLVLPLEASRDWNSCSECTSAELKLKAVTDST